MIIRLLVAFSISLGSALAAAPSERLDDPELEARARALSAELRCLVCQNQSIDASDADFAKDMRQLVRERLVAGDSNPEVLNYMTARYGDFVRMRPPVSADTILLWTLPFVVALVAVLGGAIYLRRRSTAVVAADGLSADEEAALQRILDNKGT